MTNFEQTPDVTVVIPAFNRVNLLRSSIQSAFATSSQGAPLAVECIVVDDGSSPPVETGIGDLVSHYGGSHLRVIRQANSGSAAARYHGLQEARGQYVQFLDSDDLNHPGKLQAQVAVMRRTECELSYTDQASALPYDPLACGETPPIISRQRLPLVNTPAELFIGVQTSPHNPVFLRQALQKALADPVIPMNRVFEPAGDTWLFFNCATQPWRVEKADGFYAISVQHDGERLSPKWEQTGVPALGIMLTFAGRCPPSDDTRPARALLGAAALSSYRRLPLHFHPRFEKLTLRLFQTMPRLPRLRELGGTKFALLARWLGVANAARLLRHWQREEYRHCQTIPSADLEGLMARMEEVVKGLCTPGDMVTQLFDFDTAPDLLGRKGKDFA